MDDMNRPEFTSDEEWHPETLPDGRLGPPGRKPPIAIAAAAPRPPRPPYYRYRYRKLTVMQRIARGMLSGLCVGSGALVASSFGSLMGVSAGVGLCGLGALLAIHLMRQIRDNRTIRFVPRRKRPRRSGPPESAARSA